MEIFDICDDCEEYWFHFNGGPYDKKSILLDTSGTIEFKVGSFKGYCDQKMKWVDTNG